MKKNKMVTHEECTKAMPRFLHIFVVLAELDGLTKLILYKTSILALWRAPNANIIIFLKDP